VSPIVGCHATRQACRESILRDGLIPAQPMMGRPYGVYMFRSDGGFDHLGWNSKCEWEPNDHQDLWEGAYIGPLMLDQYVLNALIFLGPVTHVTLVTGN
jgi:hypothetical protein